VKITSARVLPPEEIKTASKLDKIKKEIEIEDDKKDDKKKSVFSHIPSVDIFNDFS